MNQIFNQRATVLNPGYVESPYSSELVESWDVPGEEIDLDFLVSVQPAGSSEGEVERPTTVTQWRFFTPPGTDVPAMTAESRIRLGGTLTLEVVGVPERWPDPFRPGKVHHVEASLEVVHG